MNQLNDLVHAKLSQRAAGFVSREAVAEVMSAFLSVLADQNLVPPMVKPTADKTVDLNVALADSLIDCWAIEHQVIAHGGLEGIRAAAREIVSRYEQRQGRSVYVADSAAPVDPYAGHCEAAGGCVCGGDLPRVRAGCGNWVKAGGA